MERDWEEIESTLSETTQIPMTMNSEAATDSRISVNYTITISDSWFLLNILFFSYFSVVNYVSVFSLALTLPLAPSPLPERLWFYFHALKTACNPLSPNSCLYVINCVTLKCLIWSIGSAISISVHIRWLRIDKNLAKINKFHHFRSIRMTTKIKRWR